MCGICGIKTSGSSQKVNLEILRDMCDSIRHRGPDDEGFFVDGNVGLGMRRLSIIDLSHGSQPVFNETKTACIVFNGEIYNYQSVRADLEGRGHRFRSQSDTEVIIHAYEEWSTECPSHLDGMFAFAIWDRSKCVLVIARDRFGEKPLYYHRDSQRLIFASEIKAILRDRSVSRQINLEALDAFFTLGYSPAPLTLFKGIHKLPPGHLMVVTESAVKVEPYWKVEYCGQSKVTFSEARDYLEELIVASVKSRMVSDVPLGSFLSGGIDSSLIVAIMSQHSMRPVETFSVGFSDRELSELDYARMTADVFGANHHEILVDTCSPELVERITWHLDEPVADPALVPTFLVSKLARQNVTVALTGEGGDEFFAGYDYYRAAFSRSTNSSVPECLERHALPLGARVANSLLRRPRYHDRTIWHWSMAKSQRMLAWVALFTDDDRQNVLTFKGRQGVEQGTGRRFFARWYDDCNANSILHRYLNVDMHLWLPDDLLMKVDKMSMANSLEARAPYLNHQILEFIAGLDPRFLLGKNTEAKLILRDVAKGYLPPEIWRRKKRTFDVPIGKWLLGELRLFTIEALRNSRLRALIDVDYLLGEVWGRMENGRFDAARQIWSLLLLELWVRQYQVDVP